MCMETSTFTNTAAITSLKDFVTHVKNATRDVGATDSLSRGGAENDLSGTAEADQLHFDPIMASLLSENQ